MAITFLSAIWLIGKKTIRESVTNLIRIFFTFGVLTPLFLLYAYLSIAIILLYHFQLWNLHNLKDTIYWSLGGAFALLLNIGKVGNKKDFFKNTIWDCIKLSCMLEYIVGLYVFNFWIEIITVPLITLLAIANIFAEIKKEYKIVNKFLSYLLGAIGLNVLSFSIYKLSRHFAEFATIENLVDFLLPAFYTLWVLPFIYGLALRDAYKVLFVRLRFFNKHKKMLKFAKCRIFLFFHFRLGKLNNWVKKVNGNLHFKNKKELFERLKNPTVDFDFFDAHPLRENL